MAANDTEEGVRTRCGGLFDHVPKLGLYHTGEYYQCCGYGDANSLVSATLSDQNLRGGAQESVLILCR